MLTRESMRNIRPLNHYGKYCKRAVTISLLGTALLSGPMNLFAEKIQTKPKKYNVLFIAVDDLRPILGCYGDTQIKTPNIDKLAKQGVVFTNAYCQMPICMASRCSIMSGLQATKNKIYTNKSIKKMAPETETIAKTFQKDGYAITGIGKVYHHGDDAKDAFGKNRIWYPPKKERKWRGIGYYKKESFKEIAQGRRGPAFEDPDISDDMTLDGYWGKESLKALDKLSQNKKPFFLAVGFIKPHLPFIAPKRYWDLYNKRDLKLPANQYLPKNYNQYTVYNSPELRYYSFIPKGTKPIPQETQKKLLHGYYACVSFIDHQIGMILDRLDKLKLRDNTIIVLWADHGWKLGEHGMWGKHTNFSLDLRVPLIISVPGKMEKPGVCKSYVELTDLYPTLCQLCGLKRPSGIEGQSLVPALTNHNWKGRNNAVSVWPNKSELHLKDKSIPVTVMGYSIGAGNYRYTEWRNIKTGKLKAAELYDHRSDPGENINVDGNKKYRKVKKHLSQLLSSRFNAWNEK